MSLHCFAVLALDPEPALTELNAFLAQHRVLALQRELIAHSHRSCWVFCVELADGPGPLPAALRAQAGVARAAPLAPCAALRWTTSRCSASQTLLSLSTELDGESCSDVQAVRWTKRQAVDFRS